jgi:hypothetical protein
MLVTKAHEDAEAVQQWMRTGGEGLPEEIVGDVGQLAEHRQVGGALYLQPVRPRLACGEVAYVSISSVCVTPQRTRNYKQPASLRQLNHNTYPPNSSTHR